MPAGYSKRPLADKLGIKPASRICFIHAPKDYDTVLGPLPDGVKRFSRLGLEMDFVHAFYDDSAQLAREFPGLKIALKQNGTLWISWPKKASKLPTDVSESTVRIIGLKNGLVDVKICAVDAIWSGLKFMYRLKDRR